MQKCRSADPPSSLSRIDQIMAPGPHVHTHEPHAMGDEHPTARHDPPTRDCPEERPFRRLTRPETLHLTRSSMNFGSGKWEAAASGEGNGGNNKRKAVGDGNPASAQHNKHTHSHGPVPHSAVSSDEGSEASLPSDYHTIPHDDGTKSFDSHATINSSRWRKASAGAQYDAEAAAGAEAGASGSSPTSPLLRSPPRSPPRTRRSSHELRRSRGEGGDGSTAKSRGLRAAFTSVAGLVIHAACDGIAMGASLASHDEGLKIVVVAAIMIHKAPAAFGLCTLLVSRRLSRNDVRKAMIIFSLSTPIGALLTYFTMSTLLESAVSATATDATPTSTPTPRAVSASNVGSALTFSAGSFIYVALHAVHELASPASDYELESVRSEPSHPRLSTSDHHHAVDSGSGSDGGERGGVASAHTHTVIPKQTLGRFGRIVVLLFGAALPRGLQLIFGHGH